MRIFKRLKARFGKTPVRNRISNPGGGLFGLMNMSWIAQSVYVATELGIADYLDEGPKSSDELAELTGSDSSCVHQIMRALAGFGIFARDDKGNYGLTALAEPLVRRNGSWLRHYILLWGEQLYPACRADLRLPCVGKQFAAPIEYLPVVFRGVYVIIPGIFEQTVRVKYRLRSLYRV